MSTASLARAEAICCFCGAPRVGPDATWDLCAWCANPENEGPAPDSPKARSIERHQRYLIDLQRRVEEGNEGYRHKINREWRARRSRNAHANY
jgi:hypothetical protein